MATLEEELTENESDDGKIELGENANVQQLREALKREQLKNQRLTESNKKLKQASGTSESLGSRKNGKKPKTDAGIPAELVDHVDQIARLGKKCTVMLCLWIPDDVSGKERPSIDYSDAAKRYANPRNQEMSLVAELHDFLPSMFRPFLIGLPKFLDLFKMGNSACRSSVLYNVRSKASIIFKLNEKYFSGDHSVKDCKKILDLLGFNAESNKYSTWPPILYPENTKNMRVVFRNPALPLILKIALHGAGALNSVGKGKPKVNAQLWNVTSVNESAIAFAAIMGRFVLSKDQEFQPKGGVTGIKYEHDFWTYKKMLAKADEGVREDLINFYNEVVFPSPTRAIARKKHDEDDEEEDLTEALAAFNLGAADDIESLEDRIQDDSSRAGMSVTTEEAVPSSPSYSSTTAVSESQQQKTGDPYIFADEDGAVSSRENDEDGASSGRENAEPQKAPYADNDVLEADLLGPSTGRLRKTRERSASVNGDAVDELPKFPDEDRNNTEEAPDITTKSGRLKRAKAPTSATANDDAPVQRTSRSRKGAETETEKDVSVGKKSVTEKKVSSTKSKSNGTAVKSANKPRRSIVVSDEEGV